MNWIMNEQAISLTTDITDFCEKFGFNDFISAEEKTAGIISTYQALVNLEEDYLTDLFESLKESVEDAEQEVIDELNETEESVKDFFNEWKEEAK